MEIRRATADDAEAGVDVLCRSIADLCSADHGDDPVAIASWTANKTVTDWRLWVERDDVALLVAVEGDRMLGVGLTAWDGRVLLNYVSPAARWRGVSDALLRRMEEALRDRGCAAAVLESSVTAGPFYHDRGYRPDGSEARLLSKRL